MEIPLIPRDNCSIALSLHRPKDISPVILIHRYVTHLSDRVPGNIERVTADIMALMDSPQWRDAIAARSRRYIAEAHSAAAVVMAFVKAIAGLLS